MFKPEWGVKLSQVQAFNYCPYCGEPFPTVYLGDFYGQTECLACEGELEIMLLEVTADD